MNTTPKHTIIRLSNPELIHIGAAAAKESPDMTAFSAGVALADYCIRKIRKCTEEDISRLTPAPDSNDEPQSIPAAIPMPTPTMMLAATPAPAVVEEDPSDEDPFAEFINNQKQPTAHHA